MDLPHCYPADHLLHVAAFSVWHKINGCGISPVHLWCKHGQVFFCSDAIHVVTLNIAEENTQEDISIVDELIFPFQANDAFLPGDVFEYRGFIRGIVFAIDIVVSVLGVVIAQVDSKSTDGFIGHGHVEVHGVVTHIMPQVITVRFESCC